MKTYSDGGKNSWAQWSGFTTSLIISDFRASLFKLRLPFSTCRFLRPFLFTVMKYIKTEKKNGKQQQVWSTLSLVYFSSWRSEDAARAWRQVQLFDAQTTQRNAFLSVYLWRRSGCRFAVNDKPMKRNTATIR